MANKTIKMAAVAASVFAAMSANAATLKTNVGLGTNASGTLSVEGSTRSAGVDIGFSAAGVGVESGANYADNDIVTFTVNGGTWKDRTKYQLYSSTSGGAIQVGGSLLSGSNASEVAFRLASGALAKGFKYYLSGSNTASNVGPTVTVKNAASASTVTVTMSVKSGFGQGIDSIAKPIILTRAIKEFSGVVGTKFDGQISLTNGRKNFGTSGGKAVVTDGLSVSIKRESTPNFGAVTLDADDKVNFSITGDLAGISGVKLGSKAFTTAGNTASLNGFSLSQAIASNSVTAVATVNGTTELAARSFTTTVELNLDEESNTTVISNASAGSWTVDKLNAVVSNMTLNASGFVSWLKVVNESVVDGTLKAKATWTETDGSTVTSGQTAEFDLATIKAKAVSTVSEATILEKIGKKDAKGIVDVSLNVNIDAPKDLIHIVSEKKASNGRLTTPVYYKSRTLGQ